MDKQPTPESKEPTPWWVNPFYAIAVIGGIGWVLASYADGIARTNHDCQTLFEYQQRDYQDRLDRLQNPEYYPTPTGPVTRRQKYSGG